MLVVTHFSVEGDNPLSEADTTRVLAPFLGEHTDIDGIDAAAEALEQAIQAKGYPFIRVVVPTQKPEGGVIVLKVVRYAIGNMTVTGNKHFSEKNILASVPGLRSGETPDPAKFQRSLDIANENPAKRAAVYMRESEEPGTIDAEVKVADADPQQVAIGVSNTGTPDTGAWRASVAYQNANVFDRDQVVVASFTTSPDQFHDVKQYGLFYTVPLYTLGDSVTAFYVYSNVNEGTVATNFLVSGAGQFYGMRYTHSLGNYGSYAHKLALTLQQEQFNNDASLQGVAVPNIVDVGATPLSLRYAGSWSSALWGAAAFYIEAVHNLAVGPDNDQTAYQTNRAGADVDWNLARFGAEVTYAVAQGWDAKGRFAGQWSGQPLIPGEQFGLGGAASVRGFRERSVTGDDAYQVSAELWGPPLRPNLRLLGFFDAGYRHFYANPPGQTAYESISSFGAGVRWRWDKGLDLAFDLARVVDGCTTGCAASTTTAVPAGTIRGHLAVSYRF